MNALLPYTLTGVGLFCLGLHALLTHPHLLRKILAVNVMGSGVFLILVALAKRSDSPVPDPVPQALVITGIVVAVAATALALNLLLGLAASSGKAELAEDLDE